MSLADLLVANARLCPDHPALRSATHTLSWAAVAARVARLAGGLARLGVSAHSRVALIADNSCAYIELVYSIQWLGAVAVPLNVRWTDAELHDALTDCAPAVLACDQRHAAIGDALARRCGSVLATLLLDGPRGEAWLSFDDLMNESDPVPPADLAPHVVASLFYTGGTTGRSKGVQLTHANHLAHSTLLAATVSMPTSVRYLHAAPLFHIADSLFVSLVTLLRGTHVVIPRFSAPAVVESIASERVTDTILVPTMIQMLLDEPSLASKDLTCLRRLFYGGAPMAEPVIERTMRTLPDTALIQLYGQTESSPVLTVLRQEDHVVGVPASSRLRSAGRPALATDVRVVRADGRECDRGEVGEIVARGPQIMPGYWNRPEETARALAGGWLHTGDAGYMDADGFVFVTDRMKDMIITGGENVYSVEIENALYLHPGVHQCAVIGVPSELWGETVHAIVVPRPGMTLDPGGLTEHCARHLAAYKRPRTYTIRDTPLPLSGAGKILKRELRAAYQRETRSDARPPGSR